MFFNFVAASEFTTKIVAALSGVVFAIIVLLLALRSKNKVQKEDGPEELKRKAKKHNAEVEQSAKNKKNKKNKIDDAQDEQPQQAEE